MVGARSGDAIELGDRMLVAIDDVAVLRRSVYGRRVVPEAVLRKLESGPRRRGGPERAVESTRTPQQRDARRRVKEQKRKEKLDRGKPSAEPKAARPKGRKPKRKRKR